jgi:uncharacterized protein YgbK (DUF1537 family)
MTGTVMALQPQSGTRQNGTALEAAIVADDLTGALDSAAPFATRGMRTVVAMDVAGIDEALDSQPAPSVVAVSTASRDIAPEVAAELVTQACARLQRAEPAIFLKKIDSRLKGNVEAETRAMLAALGRSRAIVAPAVPELGRVVAAGRVRGRGVASDIAIGERFGPLQSVLDIPDTEDEAAMAFIASRCLASAGHTLAVGARGLTTALAYSFIEDGGEPLRPFAPVTPAIIAIGSRDPITLAQVERLREAVPGLAVTEAPDGVSAAPAPDAPLQLLLCTATQGARPAPEHEVAARFGQTVATRISASGARMLVLSGGDTAAASLGALGVRHIRVEGEVEPGMPWSTAAAPGLPGMIVVTKSGGFGGPGALLSAIGYREMSLV